MDSREKVSGLLLALAIFFISFGSFGSFVDNFNQSIFTLIFSVPIFYFFRRELKLGFSFYFLFFIAILMFNANINSQLIDEGRVWGRFISITLLFIFSLALYLYSKNGEKLFFLFFLMSIFGFIHSLIISKVILSYYMGDLNSIFGSLNYFGNVRHYSAFLSICFLSSYFLFFYSEKRNYFLLFLSFFTLSIILILGTRSSFLSIFVVLMLSSLYMIVNKIKFIFESLLILIISFFIQFIVVFKDSELGVVNSFDRTVGGNLSSGRTLIWKETWEYVSKNFWGYGGDAFVQLNIGIKALGGMYVQAHNIFFQITLEWGWGVFVLVLMYLTFIFYRAIFYIGDRVIFLSILSILNILIISLFDGVFYYVFEIFFLLSFIAILNSRLFFLKFNKINM